jgi:hypothetical protein
MEHWLSGDWYSVDDALSEWLLDYLCSRDDLLSDRLVHDLSRHWLIFDSLDNSLLRDVLDVAVMENLREIFGLVFDCIMFDNLSFARNVLHSRYGFVLDNRSLVWVILNSAFSLYWHMMRLDWDLIASNILRLAEWASGGLWDVGSRVSSGSWHLIFILVFVTHFFILVLGRGYDSLEE